jgi:hypothetical protein
VSRQYAVGSKQAAAAATELNTLAADLRASIAQFKTGGDGRAAPFPAEDPADLGFSEPDVARSGYSAGH